MALINHDQAKIRQYLLGRLSDEEQQKIEERLMVEDALFEELEITKGELIEEYCSGELNQNEREWFEGHYLASPEGKQRHTFTLALNCLKRPIPAPKRLTWFERLGIFFKARPWVVATATAAALLLVIAGAFIPSQFFNTEPQRSLAITLSSGAISRSLTDGQHRKIQPPPDVKQLNIALLLPESAPPATSYRVELDNRREIKALKPITQDTSSVSVVIPTAELPPAFYSLRLFAIKADNQEHQLGDYFFEIIK